jgi:aspartyl-tRNA(Asn)/glutamyl-tRNA(Gln) amidotransferase subunit A
VVIRRKGKPTVSEQELIHLTLTDVMLRLRDRSISAVEVVQAVLERYRATEHAFNAWVEVYEQEAIAQSIIADRRRSVSAAPPPLLGIPIGVKDIFDIAGKPTRCNSLLLDEAEVAHRDSEPVHRIRLAGATLIGKTVTQEFAAGVISSPARNPWDPDRIPGGSSGGSAASVASGTSFGALGSDTGGSIRIPASVTGTVGLKPTWGRIPLAGVFPLSSSLDTAGPITRSVSDAAVMHLVLMKQVPRVDATIADLTAPFGDAPLAGRRIGVLRGFFAERLQPDVSSAFEVATRHLTSLGAEVIDVEWDDAPAARATALLISRGESGAVHHDALRHDADRIGEEVRLRFEVGALLPADVYLRARQARHAVKASIAELYRAHNLDAAVAPTLPATAPLAADCRVTFADGTVESAGAALTRFTMPWNATGQPVVSVPCGSDLDGMPIGLSFIGRPDEELALCQIASAYERSTEWHRRVPPTPEPIATEST